jgi:hypothetical protein
LERRNSTFDVNNAANGFSFDLQFR